MSKLFKFIDKSSHHNSCNGLLRNRKNPKIKRLEYGRRIENMRNGVSKRISNASFGNTCGINLYCPVAEWRMKKKRNAIVLSAERWRVRKTVSKGDPVLCVVFTPPETVPPPVTRGDLAYLMTITMPVLFHDPWIPEIVPKFNGKEPLKGLVENKKKLFTLVLFRVGGRQSFAYGLGDRTVRRVVTDYVTDFGFKLSLKPRLHVEYASRRAFGFCYMVGNKFSAKHVCQSVTSCSCSPGTGTWWSCYLGSPYN